MAAQAAGGGPAPSPPVAAGREIHAGNTEIQGGRNTEIQGGGNTEIQGVGIQSGQIQDQEPCVPSEWPSEDG